MEKPDENRDLSSSHLDNLLQTLEKQTASTQFWFSKTENNHLKPEKKVIPSSWRKFLPVSVLYRNVALVGRTELEERKTCIVILVNSR
ncbi:MAG: hypothetical protein ACXADA_16115 [Candidatus Hodarchaeales archaeon]|jgi:hypothetical protein